MRGQKGALEHFLTLWLLWRKQRFKRNGFGRDLRREFVA